MVQDVSSRGGSFDLNSQAGVLRVLQAVRASNISLHERNELRDLVFLYANGGGDQAVRTLLIDRLAALGITPESVPEKAASPEKKPEPSGFSSGRPQPQFSTTHTYIPKGEKVPPVMNSPLETISVTSDSLPQTQRVVAPVQKQIEPELVSVPQKTAPIDTAIKITPSVPVFDEVSPASEQKERVAANAPQIEQPVVIKKQLLLLLLHKLVLLRFLLQKRLHKN